MTDNTESLILENLRLIPADLAGIKEDIKELKTRISTPESGQASMIQHIGHVASSIAQQQVSVDRLGSRVERIEKRLELV